MFKVWTFLIHGGDPVNLSLKGLVGPPLQHDGGHTLWKMVGTEEQALSVENMLTGPLVKARVQRMTEVQTEDQAEIRLTGETDLGEG